MKTKNLILALLAVLASLTMKAKNTYELQSPDGKLRVTIHADNQLKWSVKHQQTVVLQPSDIALQYSEGKNSNTLGKNIKVKHAKSEQHRGTFQTAVYYRKQIQDNYNSLTLQTSQGFNVEFRAYDDGAAYRFVRTKKGQATIMRETATFQFGGDYQAFAPYYNNTIKGTRYQTSFESLYTECRISEIDPDTLVMNPAAICLPDGKKAVIMDAAVEDYPGMFLVKDGQNTLRADFAPYPTEVIYRERNVIPQRWADYIAQISGACALPWRVVLVTEHDRQLLDCDMAQRLAPPCRIKDTSWIKPGKVAWDWWNNWNLTGVDFPAGINTETYKYYIDFAANNRLEYIILDEGWSSPETLMQIVPAINLEELVRYGNERNVGIILWATWRNTMRDLDNIFAHYSKMGIKGFKVDFFDRDDQIVVRDVKAISECAAKHHLLLDLHGIRAFGMQRTYPNVLNIEGVRGLEQTKWDGKKNGKIQTDFPRYDVTCPYLRMLSGPMDYTPGAMKNAIPATFNSDWGNPMSQGTRAHQVAMYVIYDAPLQMLADSPSKYMKEQETTDFIAQMPTTFDETIALDGAIGEYIVMAKRKGNKWYVGALTNWTERDLSIDLTPLKLQSSEAVVFADGVNAKRDATDYKCTKVRLSSAEPLKLHLAPGGGWAAIIETAL